MYLTLEMVAKLMLFSWMYTFYKYDLNIIYSFELCFTILKSYVKSIYLQIALLLKKLPKPINNKFKAYSFGTVVKNYCL